MFFVFPVRKLKAEESRRSPDPEPRSPSSDKHEPVGYCENREEVIIETKFSKIPVRNLNPYVQLEDWGPILARSASYCRQCSILFPTDMELDSHQISVHTFLDIKDIIISNVFIESTAIEQKLEANESRCSLDPVPYSPNLDKHEPVEYCENSEELSNSPEYNFNAYVLLENWGPTLARSASYCKECNTLFPTLIEFDSHVISVHTFLDDDFLGSEATALDSTDIPLRSYSSDTEPYSLNRNIEHEHELELMEHCERSDEPIITKTDFDFNAYVLLKDCRVILEKSSTFCKKCNTLFPTANSLDSHRISVHSFINNSIANSVATKNTGLYVDTSSNFCNHCQKHFDDNDALVDHLYELLPLGSYSCDECDERFQTSDELLVHEEAHEMPYLKYDKRRLYCCPVCVVSYLTFTSLAEHMAMNHNITNVIVAKSKPDSTCKFCNTVISKLYSNINKHIRQNHDSIYNMKTEIKIMDTKTLANGITNESTQEIPNLTEKVSDVVPGLSIFKMVPTSTLFQCSKCSLHFFSCLHIHNHEKVCVKNVRAFPTCNICSRKFYRKYMRDHKLQHENSKKINVYIYTLKLLDKIIKHCSNCDVYFEHKYFWKHVFVCVKKTPSFHCSWCNVNISSISKHSHREKHEPFITISMIKTQLAIQKTKMTCVKRKLDCSNNLLLKRQKLNITILYCTYCKCYMKDTERHRICKKSGKLSIKFRCKKCVMAFSSKADLSEHQELHSSHKIQLSDYNIINIQTNKRITRPIRMVKKTQPIETVKSKSDIIGSAKENSLPELIEHGTLNDCLVLYTCTSCQLTTDSYDDVVEHSHNHIFGLKEADSVFCDVCEIEFIKYSYERHGELHETNHNITKKSFKIIKYDFENILKPEWLSNFTSLPELQFQKILSQSIYSTTCRLKMKLHQNGPIALTMYQCDRCSCYMENTSLHTHLVACPRKKLNSQYCRKCHIYFTTYGALTKHLVLHKSNKINLKSFRIIKYNNKEDDYFNFLLSNKVNKEFNVYRCQKCHVHITLKTNIVRHLNCHTNWVECKICNFNHSLADNISHKKLHEANPRFESNNITFEDFDPEETRAEDIVVIYKCECELHFMSLKEIKQHEKTCDNVSNPQKVSKQKCKKCGLLFPSNMLAKHVTVNHKYKATKFIIKKLNSDRIEQSVDKPLKADVRDTIVLYKCGICNVHLITKGSLRRHIKKKRHYSSSECFKCKHCGLHFLLNSLMLHVSKHHNGTASEMEIVVGSNLKKTAIKYTVKINEARPVMTIDRTSTLVNANGEGDDEKSEVNENDNVSNAAGLMNKSVRIILLYKCVECNVHFVTFKKCCQHTYVHRPMPKDIVVCKICKLRFRAKSMDEHISSHHDEKYINDVIIKEYWQTKKGPKSKWSSVK